MPVSTTTTRPRWLQSWRTRPHTAWAIIRIRHRPPDGRATRTLTLDKGRLTEREVTDSAAQDANAVPDGADENEETQA